MKDIRLIFYFFIFLILAGCDRSSLFKETKILMDTFAEISCYSSDTKEARYAIDEAFKEIERIEKVFSKFDEESEVSKVNTLAGERNIVISPEMFKLLEHSIYYSKLSKGCFDITVEPFKKGRYEKIILDRDNLSVHFLDKDMKIDFGGIAKGYAVDRAKEILVSHGIKSALINIGGNIFALGNPHSRKAWQIGIRDPREKSKIIYKVNLKDRAVSTSGSYERPFHIIDPSTGEPSDEMFSVTIVAGSAEEADALSTAVFVMGLQKGLELVNSLEGIEIYTIDKTGNITTYP
jgi:thiamine biosynthesis lipoprotein ApbE